MTIWKAPTGKKHKNGKVWDPTTKRTDAFRENAQAVEKQRAKDETDGKWSVTGKNPIIQRFE